MDMTNGGERNWAWLRWVGWGGAVALVAAPFALMKLAPETGFNWAASDFVLAAVLIGTIGLLAEVTLRPAANWNYRFGAAIAVGTGLLLIWSNLAVGYIGDGDAAINGVFLIIPILALLATIIVRGPARDGVDHVRSGSGTRGRRLHRLSAGHTHRTNQHRLRRTMAGVGGAVPQRRAGRHLTLVAPDPPQCFG